MKKHKENNGVSRRVLLKGGVAASSSLLLRGLALGLPPGFLLDPSTVNAQTANVRPQTLIFATSSRGDPVNVNCPGSYTNGVENNPHLTAQRGQFGGQRARAAQPWVDLPADLRRRLAFFHHQTMSAAHSEHSQTMSLRGAVKMRMATVKRCWFPCCPSSLSQIGAFKLNLRCAIKKFLTNHSRFRIRTPFS